MTDPAPETGFAPRSVYTITINAPIRIVWDTLVKTDEVLPFIFGAVCDTEDGLKVGRPLRMVTKNRKFATVVGEVLEFAPPHRYAHTMKFTQYPDTPATVIYELKEVPGGTEFTLITENVPAGTKTEQSMAPGSKFIADNLKAVVETGRPAFTGWMVSVLGPLMSFAVPARCRIERWPFGRYE